MTASSRLPGFYNLPVEQRATMVAQWAKLTPEEQAVLMGESPLDPALADKFIENVVGVFGGKIIRVGVQGLRVSGFSCLQSADPGHGTQPRTARIRKKQHRKNRAIQKLIQL